MHFGHGISLPPDGAHACAQGRNNVIAAALATLAVTWRLHNPSHPATQRRNTPAHSELHRRACPVKKRA
ncbi:hypothetical protein PXO_01468 [Xanthomonas oryzae pv. oryzae PXO99A]|uniref:Uncharacterized protein n=1 Tax=Xanthomonas oryzae pv. oryzae (strain PXO99A) TaxID=360094 RepID=A0A0K0GMI9_XANOP|nr:hypothetical protein PXO_01468 [Xanthomonas oryzae pv. oryzae PXO99A]